LKGNDDPLRGAGLQNLVINVGPSSQAGTPLGQGKLVQQALQAAIGRDVVNEFAVENAVRDERDTAAIRMGATASTTGGCQ
jgi:hypothetical protein